MDLVRLGSVVLIRRLKMDAWLMRKLEIFFPREIIGFVLVRNLLVDIIYMKIMLGRTVDLPMIMGL